MPQIPCNGCNDLVQFQRLSESEKSAVPRRENNASHFSAQDPERALEPTEWHQVGTFIID